MKKFFIALVLGVAFGFGCAKVIDQPVVADNVVSAVENAFIKPGAGLSVIHLELEESADEEAFEDYLINDYIPKWNQVHKSTGLGSKVFLIKGVAAEHIGNFGLLVYKPDMEAYRAFFASEPPSVKLKDELKEAGLNQTQPEFEGYKGWAHHGDNIVLALE